jgi:hypothetical protein
MNIIYLFTITIFLHNINHISPNFYTYSLDKNENDLFFPFYKAKMSDCLHERDITKPLTLIERNNMIDIIFDIGINNGHHYDAIVLSVQVADIYVDSLDKNYSLELAHVVSVLAAKFNEDHGYKSLLDVTDVIPNHAIFDLEKEVYKALNYTFKFNKFVLFIYNVVGNNNLHPSFAYLLKDICYNKHLLHLDNPLLIIIALTILFKNNKLSFIRKYKEHTFIETLLSVSNEYEIKPETLLNKYITCIL